MQLTDVKSWIETNKPAIIQLHKELVEINTHVRNHDAVEQGMQYLESVVKPLGVSVKIVNDRHRVLYFENATASPRILLISHMDTVFPAEDNFNVYTDLGDGFIGGAGVGDIKGGMVMGLYAMLAIHEINPDLDVQMVISADEEIGSPTIRDWYTAGHVGADYAIGLEPGFPQAPLSADVDLGVVYQRRGYGAIRWTIEGVSSHSGTPHLGLNAIEAAALRIVKLRELGDADKGTSVTVGMIEGGRSPNTVPGSVTGTVSWRYETQADGDDLLEKIKAILDAEYVYSEVNERWDSVEYVLETFIPPMEKTDDNMKMVEIVLEEAKNLGHNVVAIARGGGSDANFTSSCGTPSICGMGAPAHGIHTHEEKIHLPMMIERIELLTRSVYRLATQ